MNAAQTTPARAWDVAGPILLVGTPPRLSGRVTLANRSAERLKVKTLDLRLTGPRDLAPDRTFALQLSARVAPGASASFTAQAVVDETMPPGTYQAEVDVGGELRAAVLHVLERREVTVAPELFDLAGAPGESVVHPAVITNAGNVEATLPKVVLAGLGEDGALHSLFHVAMSQRGREGHIAALDAYAALLAEAEVDAAKVLLGEAAGATLAPGEARAVQLTFELPARLARHRLYRGTFLIGRTRCTIELVTENGAPDTRTPRRGRK
jgi:hypothetical protein